MRRLVALALLAALALAGCGSSSSGSVNPVNTELSYFPSGSIFVMSVVTDPTSAAIKQAHALEARFPIAAAGQTALLGKLDQLGIDYQGDIRPLFGNPIMFGLTTANPTGNVAGSVLAVWVTKDAGKLSALVKKLPGIHGAGSHDGAKLYQLGASARLAVDGATAVLAPSATAVDSALDRHAHGGGITSSYYTRAFSGLPQGALVHAFGDLSTVLSRPGAVTARKVPWVAAFRGYSATVSASASGLAFNYHLDTSGGSLTPAQVPFASGTATPNLAGTLPITVGIENPAHIGSFIEAVEQVSNSPSYATFLKHQAELRAKTGADLNSLLKLLTGELIIASDLHTTMARATVSDPAAASATLSKLVKAPRDVFNNTSSVATLGRGFYAIRQPGSSIAIGIVGKQLLVGKATPTQLRAFASAPATPAPGAQGSVAFRVALVELLRVALAHAPPKVVQTILRSLRDVTGWVSASPAGINGSAALAIH